MADKLNRLAPIGNLDTDSDPRYVGRGEGRTGDTTQNRNTQIAGDAGSTSGDITPTLGTLFGFDLGEVSAQNKKYRLTFSGDATKSHQIRLLSTNRDANVANGSGTDGGIPFNGTQADFITNWNASNTANMLATYPNATTAVIEMVSYNYYQFYVESTGTDDIEVVCTQEAIPVDLAGPLKDIGSYDLLGDLFVFSTTQDNEPTELDLTVIAVGPTVNVPPLSYTGPLTFLTFNQPHGLVAGQWIRITNSNAPWLNGLFVVRQVNSATQIGIPTVLAWGGTQPLFTIGEEVVRINPTGIGEIGVAQKDDNTDAWTYTRLLRSVELNFVSKWAIDCDAEKDIRKTSLYFDDDYNSFRKFYYIGSYQTDGAIEAINSSNLYQYDTIQNQLYGFVKTPKVVIDFVSQTLSGGQLPVGGIRYFVVMKDFFENETAPSDLSQPVITYKDATTANAIGENSGTISSKINVLRISGIDSLVFKEIALGYYINVDGVPSAVLNDFISVTGSEMDIRHTGNEPKTTFDVGELIAKKEDDYKYAKNIGIIDGRVVRSNLRKEDYTDLSEWAKTFKHRICVKRIAETKPYPEGEQTGEYKEPENGFYNMGYMYNETYRMSLRAHMKDASLTDWFWVDDIRIDPFLTNQANPSDNRRDQSGPDISVSFDLTEDDVLSTSLFSRKYVLIPYIDMFGADFSATVNNRPIHEIVDRIEIGRAEVIPEVIYSGIGILSVKIETAPYVSPQVNGDSLIIDDIQRGFPIAGSWQTTSQAFPEVSIGLGVRNGDRDGINIDTYHEYPWAAVGPIGRMSGSSSSAPTGYLQDNLIVNSFTSNENLAISGLPAIINQPPLFEYPHVSGTSFYNGAFVEVQEPNGPVNNGPNRKMLTSERRILSIYSPDILMGDAVVDGFSLIDFGEVKLGPGTYPVFPTPPNPGTFQFFQKWWQGGPVGNGSFLLHMPSIVTKIHSEGFGNTYVQYDIDAIKTIVDGDRETMFSSTGFRKAYDAYSYGENGLTGGYQKKGWKGIWKQKQGPVCYIENGGLGVENQSKNPDYAIRYVQVFSRKEDKYGGVENTEYYTTNSIISTSSLPSLGVLPQGTLSVFGGDVFTQQSAIKTRYQDVSIAPAGTDPETWDTSWGNVVSSGFGMGFDPSLGPGLGQGLIFYSQNRVNSQMRYTTDDQYVLYRDTTLVPTDPKDTFAFWPQEFNRLDIDTYSNVFTPSNIGLYQVSGNFTSFIYTFDFPQRIHWSERKIYGELIDQFSIFLSLNIKDLDLKMGEINNHEDIGGELFTVQPRKYQLQYFNARGTLEASSSSVEVLIGDGSVLSRDGQTLSSYGTQHKWSCIKGLNANGKDVLYWFNAENGLVMRFGEDGTRVISARGMAAFFANYTKWVKNKDEHAFEQGIRGVWDDRRKEAIWTFTGWRLINQPWASGNLVEAGEVVTNTNAPFDTYEEFPRFFRCTATHQSSPDTEPGVGPQWEHRWEAIAYTDKSYYSIFTICFNEMTNGFRCFYGHLPKTYLRWQNTFLSSHPVHRNLIFEHRLGEPTTWYGVDTFLTGTIAPKVEDAYFEMVVNEIPEQSFGGVAVDALIENAPDRVEYRTARQYTFDNAVDFEQRDDQFYSCIKDDATLTGSPDSDGDYLRGDFLKVKVFIFGGTYNLFHSIVVKIRETLRRTNT